MGHEEVVLQGLPVEAPRLTAPAALRARLARLAALAVPPSDRDGGQREGTTQRMRPGSAAARVARHIQRRFGLRVIAERLRVEWGVSLLLH